MLDLIEALHALEDTGTTGRAAARLRISQSAVSKRIAALESRVGATLIEPTGRRVRLTGAGRQLLDEVAPLLRAMHERESALAFSPQSPLRIVATESLLGSWLPSALREAATAAGAPLPTLHAHRGRLALDRLRAGVVDAAICVSDGEDALHVEALCSEMMVIVPSGGVPIDPAGQTFPVWSIEADSLTGAWITRRLPQLRLGWSIVVVGRIESYSSAVQLARAGFGHARVPAGIAESMGASGTVPVPGLDRPIAALCRASTWEREHVQRFVAALRGAVGDGRGRHTAGLGWPAVSSRFSALDEPK